MTRRAYAPFWLVPITIALSAVVVMLVVRTWFLTSHLPDEQLLALRLVYDQIVDSYVDPPPSDELMWSAIEGMVQGLGDDYSEFVPPAEVARFEQDTTGRYAGIGVQIHTARGPPCIVFPLPNGPAERAGLRPGDVLVAADGQPIPADDGGRRARELLLGPAGTTVSVTVRRGDEELHVDLERAEVQMPSVKWVRLLDANARIGYLYVSQFQTATTAEIAAAIERLQQQAHGALTGVVIDLRFDPGGLLDEAIATANLFLCDGTIVTVENGHGVVERRHVADPSKCRYPDLPLALLVNGESASASEVLTGALQDHDRATVIGTRTWGKGLVQSIFRWSGLDFRLKLTTGVYTTPNGRHIVRNHGKVEGGKPVGGLAPDLEVAIPDDRLPTLVRALKELEPPARWRDEVLALAAQEGIELTQPPPPAEDPQLAAALTALQDDK